jgi:hypothetical protein
VVFPAPFGPIRAQAVPDATENDTSAAANTPPNARRNPETRSASVTLAAA